MYLANYLANYIDEYIWKMAKNKDYIIRQFEEIIKNNAINCNLFIARNSTNKQPINCIN